jgi:hypothetical protein
MEFQDERDAMDEINEAKIKTAGPRPTNLSAAGDAGGEFEFARFEDLARRVVQVPKDEIDEARKREDD